ncbi:MAG: 1-acyl-sn-glycerol-3-phosphate acyltransferase [Anaerolineales bacterium]|nr:MAG: 1-acyl-sn-glycerol-3-phosphate acyltransferase [Anaerolineales bacterium]
MEDRYHIPLKIRISRRFMRLFFKALFHSLGKVKLIDMENVPEDNKYVVVYNHVSLVEVPFIAAFWPTIIEIIGALAVWERGYQGVVARMWGGIQLNRTAFDRGVFLQVKKVFDADRPLMISPEGGRSHTPGLRRGKPGVAYIIDQADVLVVPVAVVGNTLEFLTEGIRGKRPTLQMTVGEPFKVPPLTGRGEERRAARQQNTDFIMAKLASMLPESYRGVYKEYQKILSGEAVEFEEPQA